MNRPRRRTRNRNRSFFFEHMQRLESTGMRRTQKASPRFDAQEVAPSRACGRVPGKSEATHPLFVLSSIKLILACAKEKRRRRCALPAHSIWRESRRRFCKTRLLSSLGMQKKGTTTRTSAPAFTLIELLVVMAIIGIL